MNMKAERKQKKKMEASSRVSADYGALMASFNIWLHFHPLQDAGRINVSRLVLCCYWITE